MFFSLSWPYLLKCDFWEIISTFLYLLIYTFNSRCIIDADIKISQPYITLLLLLIYFTWRKTFINNVSPIVTSPDSNLAPAKIISYKININSLWSYLIGIWRSIFFCFYYFIHCMIFDINMVIFQKWLNNQKMITNPTV